MTDALFLTLLCGSALAGLRATYSGWSFLSAGLIGLMLGMAVSHLSGRVARSAAVLAVGVVACYFLAASAVVARDQALAGVVPTPGSVRFITSAGVFGWKQLLTTLPPVDGTGELLDVPFILGLAAGSIGFALARRTTRPAAPLPVPVVLFGAAIALGTRHRPGWLWNDVLFGAVLLGWAAIRDQRRRPAPRVGAVRERWTRASAGIAVLAVAASVTGSIAAMAPSASAGRQVLRDHVTPPFDLAAYPSPLVGFRKYTKDANQVWDQTLFTVSGLPVGVPVRIATLDDYDGLVWGATNGPADDSFRRVGTTIDVGASGPEVTVRFTISPAYALANDANAWLPSAGTPVGIRFTGGRGAELASGFRYNLGTSSGIVPARFQAGDTFTERAVLATSDVPADAQPFGRPALSDSYQAVLGSRVATWSKGSASIASRLTAVASYLRDSGAYSDGGPSEGQYLPGHSIGRLSAFMNAPRPVGDDEQYAAAFALIANDLGMPARVVLGALPEADGVVRGSDVHAWVEIHVADGRWARVPDSAFVPDVSKRPDAQQPQHIADAASVVVPPPNSIHPRSAADEAAPANSTSHSSLPPGGPVSRSSWFALVLKLLVWAGIPLLVLALPLGSIIGVKARRRHLRRTRGPLANRIAAGWRELVDHARDLGTVVPSETTRLQQARSLAGPAESLARAADAVVYGPGDPTGEQVEGYWRQIGEARRELSRNSTRRRRLLAWVSLRTLRRLPLRRLPRPAAPEGA